MKLIEFRVQNYKVFKHSFRVKFRNEAISILTGRNNTGKSTFLEAINCFFMNESKAKTIPINHFSNSNNKIIMEAVFQQTNTSNDTSQETNIENITIRKEYKVNEAPKYFIGNTQLTARSQNSDILTWVHSNPPYYITPYMTIDDVNRQIQNIYQAAMENDLLNIINNADTPHELATDYITLIKSLPNFIKKLKIDTDTSLSNINSKTSNYLQKLFSNPNLSLEVKGAEGAEFTYKDILKYTDSNVYITSNDRTMFLQDQGTGLQRMSLIFLIQNMIKDNLLGNIENKLLLIDEPEAFLHPEAVRALSDSLYNIGRDMPLIISTHSPVLINLSESHTSLQIFRIEANDTGEAVELFTSDREKFDDDDFKNMKMLNYVDSYVNEFFFTNNNIIVEGDTEYIALKTILKQTQESNYHIIRARGKDTIVTLMKILNQFNCSYIVIHDVDNDKDTLQPLKTQLTKCKKIVEQKLTAPVPERITIISSISNFEKAIGLNNIPNNLKTENIFNIVTDQSFEPSHAKACIHSVLNYIDSPDTELIGNFKIINTNECYDELFIEKIEELSNV